MNKLFTSIMVIGSLINSIQCRAQSRLYLDLKVGANHNFAEGAYFGKGEPPFKAYSRLTFHEQGVVMIRLQVREKWSISAGYSGSTLGWAYSIRVPEKFTANPYGGEQRGISTGAYMHQWPLLIGKTIKGYNIREIDDIQHIYLASFKLDIVAGGGLNRIGNNCLSCNNSNGGILLYDLIEFEDNPIVKSRLGGFLIGGITSKFYRLGKERLNLSFYYTQGLTDMLIVPVNYRYNSETGSTTLHVRGSGFSATLGVPIRLKSFNAVSQRGK